MGGYTYCVLISESLCCKSGLEYEQFYKASENGKIFRFGSKVSYVTFHSAKVFLLDGSVILMMMNT